jgi:hypothetical protein
MNDLVARLKVRIHLNKALGAFNENNWSKVLVTPYEYVLIMREKH